MRVLQVTVPIPTAESATTTAPVARQIESLRQLGLDIDHLEVDGVRRLKYLTILPQLRRRAQSADLVHAHYGYCGWLARSQRQKPIVVSFMGTDLLGDPNPDGSVRAMSKIPVEISRLLARRFSAVIVKSQQMADLVAPVPAHVLPNGVDTSRFRPIDRDDACEALGWSRDTRRVLFPGNPRNARKNHPLAREATDVAAQFLGQPIALETLWDVQPDDVPLYMNACDAMVMTSFLEGSPNVVKEAMACNLAVVAVPVGDVEELLDGVPGYAVCERSPESMGSALAGVLSSEMTPDGRSAIGRHGLDLESVANRLAAIYREVLA